MSPIEPPPGKKLAEALFGLGLIIGVFILIKFIVMTIFALLAGVFSAIFGLLRQIFDKEGLAEEARQKAFEEEEHRRNVQLQILRKREQSEREERERDRLIETFGSLDQEVKRALVSRENREPKRRAGNLPIWLGLFLISIYGFMIMVSQKEADLPNEQSSANETSPAFRLPEPRPLVSGANTEKTKENDRHTAEQHEPIFSDINGLWTYEGELGCRRNSNGAVPIILSISDTTYSNDVAEFSCEIDQKTIRNRQVHLALSCSSMGEPYQSSAIFGRHNERLIAYSENGVELYSFERCPQNFMIPEN